MVLALASRSLLCVSLSTGFIEPSALPKQGLHEATSSFCLAYFQANSQETEIKGSKSDMGGGGGGKKTRVKQNNKEKEKKEGRGGWGGGGGGEGKAV